MGFLYNAFGFDPFGENKRREKKELEEYCNELQKSSERITNILNEPIDMSSPLAIGELKMRDLRIEREMNRMKWLKP